jgi:hypothetical protein
VKKPGEKWPKMWSIGGLYERANESFNFIIVGTSLTS